MPSSTNTSFAAGMRVLCRDAEWLVTRVSPADKSGRHNAIHCVGADDLVRGQERIFLEQLDVIEPVDPRNTALVPDGSSGYRMARLFLEAQLRQMPVTGIDPDLARMGVFEPMEYQRQAVHRALLQLRPRLLLADAVGLGKTIEVGMIITELMRRGRANRILVLAKKSMLTQFQSELWNRFGIPLVRLDSLGIARLRLRIPANKNPFEIYHRIIISIDTLKDVGRYRHFLEETRWDVVVIDEAHNVAGASVPERHLSHRLARLLARRTDSLLLTTATPHNGQRETFARLISLLDPSAIPDPRFREYEPEDIKDFFLMRFKEDVREEAGENFKDRHVVPLDATSASASEAEERVLDVFARMRAHNRNLGISGERIDTLIQYGLYKLFLSSPEACASTAHKRLEHLKKHDPQSNEKPYLRDLQDVLNGQSIGASTRYKLLKKQLKELGWDGGKKSPRVLIFTEYRQTQEALVAALVKDFNIKHSKSFDQQPDQAIGVIHGGVPDIHLMKTVESFGTGSSPMRMLVATDVASEGINLHHECHNIIHFDLPWSIITLIQRNGRIDRFGQRNTPCLRYLMVNSRQEQLAGDRDIFDRLITKVEEINRSTRSGESVLKLYDPEAEERYIAEKGILAGNTAVLESAATVTQSAEASALEEVLRSATKEGEGDYLKFLLGEGTVASSTDEAVRAPEQCTSRLRLYNDRDFLVEGYRYLAELNHDYRPIREDGHMVTVDAPGDLSRRLGSPNMRDDVVFGATAIPSEAWPEHDQFQFTDNLDHANLAIQAARNTAGHWAKVHMILEQNPVLQWVAERLVMVMKRGQAPHILSKDLNPGELCFCFIGQVSSKSGTPLVVDAHAISFEKGGVFKHRSLAEALQEAQFKNLINKGEFQSSGAAEPLIAAAVDASLEHMRRVKHDRDAKMAPLLRKETRRLRNWKKRRVELLEKLIADGDAASKRWRREIDEINAYAKDREDNWQRTYFDATAQPSTRLVLVIEGGE